MINKKGFTLVELIAVIALIGLIAIVVTPMILNGDKNAKISLLNQKIENIESSAVAFGQDNKDKFTDCIETEENPCQGISNCYCYSDEVNVGDLLDAEVLHPDQDSETEKDIKNPLTGESLKEENIIIYQKYGKVYAYLQNADTLKNTVTAPKEPNYIETLCYDESISEFTKQEELAYQILCNAKNAKEDKTPYSKNPQTIPAKYTSGIKFLKNTNQDISYDSDVNTISSDPTITYTMPSFINKDYKVDEATGKFELINPTTVKYSSIANTQFIGSYFVFGTETKNISTLYRVITKIKDINSNGFKYGIVTTTKEIFTEKSLSEIEDAYGTSYYFRGDVNDNYLEFNNMCFRIVRIEGDGSVKITLAKEDKCSTLVEDDINSALINNAIEISYGYDEEYDSEYNRVFVANHSEGLSKSLNAWYEENNFNLVESSLKNDIWCLGGNTHFQMDSTGYILWPRYSGSEGNYKAGLRAEKYEIDLNCNKTDEMWGKYENSFESYIGTLTSDEVLLAGASRENENLTYYLNDNVNKKYWTLSMSKYMTGMNKYDYIFTVGTKLDINSVYYVPEWFENDYVGSAVRPAITLKSGITISEGDGTINNPYIVE